jgi:hypothetical protein
VLIAFFGQAHRALFFVELVIALVSYFGFAISEPDAFIAFARSKGASYLDAKGGLARG